MNKTKQKQTHSYREQTRVTSEGREVGEEGRGRELRSKNHYVSNK